jgi:hypothetical protein
MNTPQILAVVFSTLAIILNIINIINLHKIKKNIKEYEDLRLRELDIAKRHHDEYIKQLSKGKSRSSKGLTE